MNVYTLENETFQLDVVPEVGASIAGLRVRLGDRWEPLMRPTPAEAIEKGTGSRFSSFILAPYSNRIRDAQFTFQGQEYALEPNPQGTAQHGDVRGRPWNVLGSSLTSLECRIGSYDFYHVNFPFAFWTRVFYQLEGDSCEIRLTLASDEENGRRRRMPAGFGLHPYFNRHLGGASDLRLGFRADGVYETGPDLIPNGPMVPVPEALDFSSPRPVGDQALDHVFGGWDGQASLEWPGTGARLEFECDPVFSHLVVFTAPDGTLAVEPVSHATDGFNLLARGVAGTGVRVLEPGQAMAGSVRLRFTRP